MSFLTRFNRTIVPVLVTFAFSFGSNLLTSQGTEFTYQGELRSSGQLVNGAFDLEFGLWDAVTNGNLVGLVAADGVSVANGRFTAQLDFGTDLFSNSVQWIEVSVDGSTLSPRQKITGSPFSIQTRGIFVDANDQIGIGTAAPNKQLELMAHDDATMRLTTTSGDLGSSSILQFKAFDSPSIFDTLGRLEFLDEQDELRAFIQGTGTGSSAQFLFNVTPGQTSQMSIDSGGANVEGSLDVSGDVNTGGTLNVSAEANITGVLDVEGGLTVDGDLDANVEGTFVLERFGPQGILGVFQVVRDAVSPGPAVDAEILDSGSMQTHWAGRFVNRNNGGEFVANDYGVWGEAASGKGRGVFGLATSAVGDSVGVAGNAESTSGTGVEGVAISNNGVNYGVVGRSNSTNGYDFFAEGAGVNYGSQSSQRWKRNIKVVSDSLEMLEQIRGVYYDWDEEHGGHHDIGMIAEEVGQVLPEIVNYEPNGIDAIGMDYSKLAPVLVESIKQLRREHSQEIDELWQSYSSELDEIRSTHRSQMAQMETRLLQLERRLTQDQVD